MKTTVQPGIGRAEAGAGWLAVSLSGICLLLATLAPLGAGERLMSGSAPRPSLAAPAPSLCLLSPHSSGIRAVLPVRRPTLFVAAPLEEVRLLQGGRLLWQREAAGGEAMHGPIAWPLAPIRAWEAFNLLLRPRGAAAGAFARVELVGADGARLERSEQLLAHLQQHEERWLDAVEQALAAGDLPLAAALLFAAEGPSQPELDALRRDVFHRASMECPAGGRGDDGGSGERDGEGDGEGENGRFRRGGLGESLRHS